MNRRWFFLLLSFLFVVTSLHAGDDWLPIDKNDQSMKEYPGRPGSSAVILYRKRSIDANKGELKVYYRIKILSEEGKKFANVETDPMWGGAKVTDVKARTIQPDGSIVEFTGKPLEKVIARYKSFKVVAQTFVLPDVRVGSIVEYMYKVQGADGSGPRWMLEEEAFSREAHFYFQPSRYAYYPMAWATFTVGEQQGAKPTNIKGAFHLDLKDVEPLEKEPSMPPVSEVRSWIKFFYSQFSDLSTDDYWKEMSKLMADYVDGFVENRSDVNKIVPTLFSPSDPAETKLRKLYAHVQGMRNITYERKKEEKEAARDKSKDNKNVNDVLKRGYGYDAELLRLFVAMARAAGMDAHVVLVAPRQERFFHKQIRDSEQISDEVALVKVDGKEYWLDPSIPFCPFGLIGWQDTTATGLLVKNKKETEWIKTPDPRPEEAKILRDGDFKLNGDGDATGTLKVTYSGREALQMRLGNRFTDDAERKKDAETRVTGWLPSGAKVKVKDIGDFKAVDAPIVMSFEVEIPGVASSTGSRLLLPATIFPNLYKNPFDQRSRHLPVYVEFPWHTTDTVNLNLPEGTQVVSLAQPRKQQTAIGEYNSYSLYTKAENKLQLIRDFKFDGVYLPPSTHYSHVWLLYNVAHKGDEEQAVLKIAEAK